MPQRLQLCKGWACAVLLEVYEICSQLFDILLQTMSGVLLVLGACTYLCTEWPRDHVILG